MRNILRAFAEFVKQSSSFSIHITMSTLNIVDIAISALGFPTCLYCIKENNILLGIATFFASISAVGLAVINGRDNIEENDTAFAAADAIAGVILTLSCTITIGMHNNCVGIFKTLWLVLLVTSSSSYVFFATFLKNTNIPNDISLIALGISSLILFVSAVYVRFKKKYEDNDDDEKENNVHLLGEYSLVTGALILRLDEDLEKTFGYNIGYIFWHLFSWIAAVLCVNKSQ